MKRVTSRPALAAAVATLAVAASACSGGDSGSGTSSSTEPATSQTTGAGAERDARDRFVAEADALCTGVRKAGDGILARLERIEAGTQPEQTKARQLARVFGDQIRIIADFRGRLASLEPPPGDEARVGELLAALDDGAAALTRVRAALADGDFERANELLPDYVAAVDEGNRLAREYGFEVCGSGPASGD